MVGVHTPEGGMLAVAMTGAKKAWARRMGGEKKGEVSSSCERRGLGAKQVAASCRGADGSWAAS